jgi:DNA-binding response OmpR family regulator
MNDAVSNDSRRFRVLIVDDQVDVARTMASVLPSDFDCHFCENGQVALEYLMNREEAVDLVVTDLQMPPGEWGGLWFIDEVRKAGNRMPILVLSGQGGQRQTIEAQRLGADDFVLKEDVATELADQARRLLRSDVNIQRQEALLQLVQAGEGATVEFKQTLRADATTGELHRGVELAAVKSMAAFMNSSGGTLLIGVDDSGTVTGLEPDLKLISRGDLDGFEQTLRNLLIGRIDKASCSRVSVEFVTSAGKTFCAVSVPREQEPQWVEEKGNDILFVRVGNGTMPLKGRDAHVYLTQRG